MTEPEPWPSPSAPARTPADRPARDAWPLLLTLGLALAAYLLTRDTARLGLNALLLTLALSGVVVATLRWRGQPVRPEALALLGFGLLCALGLTVRDGDLMLGLNLLGVLVATTVGAAYLRFPGLTRLGVGGLLLTILWGNIRGLSGFPLLAWRFPWTWPRPVVRLSRLTRNARTRPVLIGLLFTLPLLAVFGSLLGAADARFAALLARPFEWRLPQWNADELIFAVVQLGFWAFLLGGPVYAALLANRPAPATGVDRPAASGMGLTELGLPLLSTSLLFCVYLGVQAETFFGRQLVAGLTYSEYVRRGFGELTAVAALTLAVLLLAHTLLRRDLRATLAYRLISAAVLLPLALLIVSAYGRLALYVGAYGLSEVRVLGGVFLGWVVLSLATYTVLLWRGGLERFAYFSLISGLGLIVGLNGVNPGRLIATVNLSRAIPADGQGGQAHMRSRTLPPSLADELAGLGADAVPVIINFAAARPLDTAALCTLAQFIPPTQPDWRVWNVARSRAAALVYRLELASPLVPWGDCQHDD